MDSEIKQCQNCKKEFLIEPQDFVFYGKMQVPAPTWCPECRLKRRLVFRGDHSLYKRKCGLCGKEIIACESPEKLYPVYCEKCWWSDNWDSENYGQEYDHSKSFWEQYKELRNRVPRVALYGMQNENCPYSNYTWVSKNCYLSPSTLYCENINYSSMTDRSKDCTDCLETGSSELCYENIQSEKNYNCCFLFRSQNCLDSTFLFDCRNCKNCFMSSNLRNKEYVFENKQYSKDDYFLKLKNIDFKSYDVQKRLKNQFVNLIKNAIHKYANILKSKDSEGDNIISSKNISYSFTVRDSENIHYGSRVLGTKDSYDINNAGPGCELFYEGVNIGLNDSRYKFSVDCWEGNFDLEYSDLCIGCNNVFGCVSLKNKEYTILNKRYSKSEYFNLVEKIKKQMTEIPYIDKIGQKYTYGEFLPIEFSPFFYNTTLAQEYFPLTKEQALEQGYNWKDPEERNIKIDLKTEDLPDNIKDVSDSIIGKIIECANVHLTSNIELQTSNCTTAFKIIPQELEFYRKMNLPLPRLCPNCRHYERLKQRNPLKLWHRQCMCGGKISRGLPSGNSEYTNTIEHFHGDKPCPNEFETSYAPDRPEIVYCEECYKREVN